MNWDNLKFSDLKLIYVLFFVDLLITLIYIQINPNMIELNPITKYFIKKDIIATFWYSFMTVCAVYGAVRVLPNKKLTYIILVFFQLNVISLNSLNMLSYVIGYHFYLEIFGGVIGFFLIKFFMDVVLYKQSGINIYGFLTKSYWKKKLWKAENHKRWKDE